MLAVVTCLITASSRLILLWVALDPHSFLRPRHQRRDAGVNASQTESKDAERAQDYRDATIALGVLFGLALVLIVVLLVWRWRARHELYTFHVDISTKKTAHFSHPELKQGHDLGFRIRAPGGPYVLGPDLHLEMNKRYYFQLHNVPGEYALQITHSPVGADQGHNMAEGTHVVHGNGRLEVDTARLPAGPLYYQAVRFEKMGGRIFVHNRPAPTTLRQGTIYELPTPSKPTPTPPGTGSGTLSTLPTPGAKPVSSNGASFRHENRNHALMRSRTDLDDADWDSGWDLRLQPRWVPASARVVDSDSESETGPPVPPRRRAKARRNTSTTTSAHVEGVMRIDDEKVLRSFRKGSGPRSTSHDL
ncbi:uncharacterized protein MONBRDRAFT_26075 [Monosiga brevicollis MX1]|uniref:FHA domain-containing protein n=1 Tax=Monosiga brevicollis TaxID=81824 RepID=A9V1A8_MONBE|nr:uncharacterized protein MONBRDRAFT_26075 [Monosiga brevicollis MX1]EDQ88774.1 predicted protein [Monosiga brevicollis MX1]|eukprot:XP_001746387.1 hypothetical protein [Monosiga brevicollis MX1]